MLLYNIRKEQFAERLTASGQANRWNKNEEFVIYCGGSISLSTLELVVHRSSIKIKDSYKLMIIEAMVDPKDISTVDLDQLPANWKSMLSYPELQQLGSQWYQSKQSLLLKVPSAVVPSESNFVINTQHKDFNKKIKLKAVETFVWDSRLL